MRACLFRRNGIYQAKFKLDSWTVERRESLGTSDKRIAQAEMEKRLREHELVAAGMLAPKNHREGAKRELVPLFDSFEQDLKAREKATGTIRKYRVALNTVREETGWKTVAQVTEKAMRDWMQDTGLRPKTRNDYLAAWKRFCRYLKREKIVAENVCEHVEYLDTKKTAREYRRALTEEEAIKLLTTAPHPRRIFYRLILETGLRPLELRRLRVGDFQLEPIATEAQKQNTTASGPLVRVPGSITKNGKPAILPISPELAAQLREIIPAGAAPSGPAFVKLVPKCPAFRKDLATAGIAPIDELGRRADMHALRKTFGTHLVLSGAEPRVVMEAMRHSDLKLTMKTYTDAAQLRGPVLSAVTSLPWHSLANRTASAKQADMTAMRA